ncbi:phosphohistidine phosphatase SixA [Candidatus Micrarchaeota archaeon]|nr:phosphohistidine phosphatase SixA [Candidatus Micrarchaeota archaeon]
MRVYLVQHGKAVPKEENPEKPLSKEGKKETQKIAEFLKKKISISKIYSSKKPRAVQTAEIFAQTFSAEKEEVDFLNPLDYPLNAVKIFEEDVMIVGHLPFLAKLCSLLLKAKNEPVNFENSGVVCLLKEENWKLDFIIKEKMI